MCSASGWQRSPKLTQVELYRRWWKWLCATPQNLALVRLNYEAATLEPTVTGLAGDVRADQIGVWRHDVEQRLVSEGLKPERAALEASLIKATFTGLVMDSVRHRRHAPTVEGTRLVARPGWPPISTRTTTKRSASTADRLIEHAWPRSVRVRPLGLRRLFVTLTGNACRPCKTTFRNPPLRKPLCDSEE